MGDLAIAKCQFGLALECLHHAKDYSGMMLLATSAGDADTLQKLAELSSGEGQNNVAFTANFCLGKYVLTSTYETLPGKPLMIGVLPIVPL